MPFGITSEQQGSPMSRCSLVLTFWVCFPLLGITVSAQAEKKVPVELKRMKGGEIPGSLPKHCVPAGSSCLGMGQSGGDAIAWAEI